MATIDQIMRALSRFADNEVLPRLPTGKGIAAGIALALVMEGGRDKLLALREHPVVQMMGVMDESGNVDVEKLYSVARPKLDGKKLPVSVPIIGELRFDVNDLDRLYSMVQEEM